MGGFGMPMGPFRLNDLVGSDIGLHVGKNFVESFSERVRGLKWGSGTPGLGAWRWEAGSGGVGLEAWARRAVWGASATG